CDENWILITSDKDFGEKVFRGQHPHQAIVFLRLADTRANNKIEVLSKLLDSRHTSTIPMPRLISWSK
ncbi:MAG: DUF5615 family PIN-like protein, partial [Blastocatellia bacterium]